MSTEYHLQSYIDAAIKLNRVLVVEQPLPYIFKSGECLNGKGCTISLGRDRKMVITPPLNKCIF